MESPRVFRLQPLEPAGGGASRAAFCEDGRRRVLAAAGREQVWLREGPAACSLPLPPASTPLVDLCFDPTGAWLLLLSAGAVHAVPAGALLRPGQPSDVRWAADRPTALPLHAPLVQPTAIVWWQTELCHPIAIVGDQTGGLTFISLQNYKVIRKSYIVGKVCKLIIYVNDDDDSVILLITSNKGRQWNLTLEKRIKKENHPVEKKKSSKSKDGNKKFDDFLTTLKELGSDKMNSLFQIRSNSTSNVPDKFNSPSDNKNPTPISLVPNREDGTDPAIDDESCVANKNSRWVVSPQSANGHHFVSIFNPNIGTFALHRSMEDRSPVYAYKFKDLPADISKIIWEQKIIYLFGTNSIEIHSTHFSSQEDDTCHSIIWSDYFEEGEHFIDAWSINESSTDPIYPIKWSDSTDVDNLDLPEFHIGSCLVVTNKRIYLLSTTSDILKWIIEQLIDGKGGIERIASALQIPLRPLLISAADILLARKRFKRAMPMFRSAKLASDDILNRLGALGFYGEMIHGGIVPNSTKAADISLLVHILHGIMNKQLTTTLLNFIENNNQYTVMLALRLLIDLGLWDAVKIISLKKGKLWPTFQAIMEHSNSPCRGCLLTLLERRYTQFLITDDALSFLKYIDQYCETFDNELLKKLCIWMCPLQDCFRILFKALSTSQPNSHLSKMRRLVRTFFGVISTLHSRIPLSKTRTLLAIEKNANPDISMLNNPRNDLIASENNYPCVISCGHNHWGIACNGKIKLISSGDCMSYVDVDISLLGKIISVACGRHHTLILSENGLYSMGNNFFGQLGTGTDINASDTPLLIGAMKNDNDVSDDYAWFGEKIVQIAAGQYHSACVTDRGNLYTWGWGIHGQLAHGMIYNEFFPRIVTTIKNKKISYVGCGSCHTAILTTDRKLYVCGNGAFGQMGDSTRHKSNIPLLIDFGNNPVVMIAVGYFHTLALLHNNELWTWGSSPQKLRLGARSAKRKAISVGPKMTKDDSFITPSTSQTPQSPVIESDIHLYPTKVDTMNVLGIITKISAGWHHSALVDNNGLIYVWGLNLDCQLGTGNCTELLIPTNVQLPKMDYEENRHGTLNNEIEPSIGCGGDFTIHVNSKGRVFVTGNTLVQKSGMKEGEYRVFFKNTTRVIRVPNHHTGLQKLFRYVTVLEDMDYQDSMHIIDSFKWPKNPIPSLKSFDNPDWAIELLKHLHQFIDDDTPLFDNHLRALLSVLREDYAEALNLQLNNLFQETQNTPALFLKHDKIKMKDSTSDVNENSKSELLPNNLKLLQNLVKNVCRKLLEEGITDSMIVKLDCLCNERNDLKIDTETEIDNIPADDIPNYAMAITQSLFNIIPSNSKIWTECVDEATTLWIDHKLKMEDLENILAQKVSDHTIEMGSAIFCNTKNVDFQKHMSTSFNLELCNSILQSL